MESMRVNHRLASVPAAVLFGLLAVLAFASPASAHASLVGTDPARGTIADVAPTVITLRFSESVQPVAERTRVVAPDGKEASAGKAKRGSSSSQVKIPLKKGLGKGTYVVSYRIISADGHPVSGGYTFSILTPSKAAASVGDTSGLNADDGGAAVDPWVRGVQSATRYMGYAGISLLAGPVLMLLALWPRRLSTKGPGRLAWTGWGLLFAGTLGTVVLQQPYTDGDGITGLSFSGLGSTAETTVGAAMFARLAFLLAAAPVLVRILKPADPEEDRRVDRVLVAVLGVAILLSFPFAGHAGQSVAPFLSVPAIAVHVGAMAIWLGGLVVLAGYLLPRAKYRELQVILPVWSRWASISVVAIIGSGTIETFLEIGGVSGLNRLFTTTWGQLVVTKIIWLGAILVVAANSRTWVRRRFTVPVAYAFAATEEDTEPAGAKDAPKKAATTTATKDAATKSAEPKDAAADAEPNGADPKSAGPKSAATKSAGPKKAATKKGATRTKRQTPETSDFSASGAHSAEVRRLRSRVAVEVALATVVLGLATALVQAPPARSVGNSAAGAGLPYSEQVKTNLLTMQIDIDPAKVGTNSIHLTAYDDNGLPVKVLEWGANSSLPASKLTVETPVVPVTENHAVGQVELPLAGEWTFTFTARTSDVDQATVTRKLTIR
jgi:methionine-rich copper-binding protein CopC/putative copper export protein